MLRINSTRFLSLVVLLFVPAMLFAGNESGYRVLTPITSGNLSVFPVATSQSHDTSRFLALDEGVRAGSVVVTESGNVQGLIRGPHPVRRQGAEVNNLVLLNNSNRPLLLLAGEIVTGGKQDRVIGEDRIIPANSGPVDLSVFCVEPGRWVDKSETFSYLGAQMAAPSVRRPALAEKNQQRVWDNVRRSNAEVAANMPSAVAGELSQTTSYAQVMQNHEVKDKVAALAAPMERNYDAIFRELRKQNAVGVVVAVNGRIIWADIFASTDLLQTYWPKLIRSYAAEALANPGRTGAVGAAAAQAYINKLDGSHEVVETDPGVYRRSEITGDGFKVFSIVSLLPSTNYTVHLAKTENSMSHHELIVPR
jgi:ARG and Rhodanese-Phosphatase-superfamily-associated Protein domain